MGPLKKRRKANAPPTCEATTVTPAQGLTKAEDTNNCPPSTTAAARQTRNTGHKDATSLVNRCTQEASSVKPLRPKTSWYGTWPQKSVASTQVATESILADTPKNKTHSGGLNLSEPKKFTPDARPHYMFLGKSKEILDIAMGGALEDETMGRDVAKPGNPALSISGTSTAAPSNHSKDHPTLDDPTQSTETAGARPTSSVWFGGWLGRPVSQPATVETSKLNASPSENPSTKEVSLPNLDCEMSATSTSNQNSNRPQRGSHWFGLWPTASPAITAEASTQQYPVKITEPSQEEPVEDASGKDKSKITQPAVGASWAFWSTDPNRSLNSSKKSADAGLIAVVGEQSQKHLEPAKVGLEEDDMKVKSSNKSMPESKEVVDVLSKTQLIARAQQSATPSLPAVKNSSPNLLLPSVRNTYRLCENPSILQQISRLLQLGRQKPVKHVLLTKDLPKLKKTLAIGIHGLFPAPLLRTVIGQPTGTSVRFANHAAEAIRRWTDEHGSPDCEIEKVALEAEGKIADRVDSLWKLLFNWLDHVRKADFILLACHSQGVPVAIILVAKLIEFGVVSTGRIGVCAMAGVSLGPFSDYKSRLFSGSAGELFAFANPESLVSKRYEESLRVAVKYGVRITYCGSIDDQLVSMESAIFSVVSHPYIYRAVFVDGRIHAPDFLSHLVGFALKLRNLGVSDHGLIRELSAPLAGSLYTGEGHSRLYDDGKVYDLAIEYALETTSVGDVPLHIDRYEIPTNTNPYTLPWIMRGLLEEDFVKTELHHESIELLRKFDDWKPATKVLKDVKYRLEAVRSKL